MILLVEKYLNHKKISCLTRINSISRQKLLLNIFTCQLLSIRPLLKKSDLICLQGILNRVVCACHKLLSTTNNESVYMVSSDDMPFLVALILRISLSRYNDLLLNYNSGLSCSKLTMSLVNVSLNL